MVWKIAKDKECSESMQVNKKPDCVVQSKFLCLGWERTLEQVTGQQSIGSDWRGTHQRATITTYGLSRRYAALSR